MKKKQYFQSGEIATTLTILSFVIMTLGVFVGGRFLAQSPVQTGSRAQASGPSFQSVSNTEVSISGTNITRRSVAPGQFVLNGTLCFQSAPPSGAGYRMIIGTSPTDSSPLGASVTRTPARCGSGQGVTIGATFQEPGTGLQTQQLAQYGVYVTADWITSQQIGTMSFITPQSTAAPTQGGATATPGTTATPTTPTPTRVPAPPGCWNACTRVQGTCTGLSCYTCSDTRFECMEFAGSSPQQTQQAESDFRCVLRGKRQTCSGSSSEVCWCSPQGCFESCHTAKLCADGYACSYVQSSNVPVTGCVPGPNGEDPGCVCVPEDKKTDRGRDRLYYCPLPTSTPTPIPSATPTPTTAPPTPTPSPAPDADITINLRLYNWGSLKIKQVHARTCLASDKATCAETVTEPVGDDILKPGNGERGIDDRESYGTWNDGQIKLVNGADPYIFQIWATFDGDKEGVKRDFPTRGSYRAADRELHTPCYISASGERTCLALALWHSGITGDSAAFELFTEFKATDVDSNGCINARDFSQISARYFEEIDPTNQLAQDINRDGIINGLDLSYIYPHWLEGECRLGDPQNLQFTP